MHLRRKPGLCRVAPTRCLMRALPGARLEKAAYVSVRQRTSAYVSLRQHTSAYVSIRCSHTLPYAHSSMRSPGKARVRQRTSVYVSMRQHTLLPHIALCALTWKSQHTSAYVRITSAYVSIRCSHTQPYARFSRRSPGTQLLRCQCLYFCTSTASKVSTWHSLEQQRA